MWPLILENLPRWHRFLCDAVGGVVTSATIPLMKRGAVWYHFGLISVLDQLIPGTELKGDEAMTPELKRIYEERDWKPILLLAFDVYCHRRRVEEELVAHMKNCKLKAPMNILKGLESLPHALVDGTFGGTRWGKHKCM